MCMGAMDEQYSNDESSVRGRALVQVLSFVLEKMIAANGTELTGPITKFHALQPPAIGLEDYLFRIYKYANCSPECFVFSLIYIDRLIQENGFVLTALNVHRVLITAVVLAIKFFDDQYFNNAYYGKVGGVTVMEMNSLEMEFLFLINFSLHVTPEVYAHYYNELANHYVFANALAIYTSPSIAIRPQNLRHYIAHDPQEDNKLVYVTHEFKNYPTYTPEPPAKRQHVVSMGMNG